MIDLRKFVLVLAMICCVVLSINAQVVSVKKETKNIVALHIMHNGVRLKSNDSITKGDTLHFIIKWDTLFVDKVIFKNLFIPRPNREEIQMGEYSFMVIPRRTRTFKCVAFMKTKKELPPKANFPKDFPQRMRLNPRIIVVEKDI